MDGRGSWKERLARGAAGVQALFTDEGVREKAGALLKRNLERGGASVRTSLQGVLERVKEADLRSLTRRADEDPQLIDLQVGARVYETLPKIVRRCGAACCAAAL
jgi:hypothetical protein